MNSNSSIQHARRLWTTVSNTEYCNRLPRMYRQTIHVHPKNRHLSKVPQNLSRDLQPADSIHTVANANTILCLEESINQKQLLTGEKETIPAAVKLRCHIQNHILHLSKLQASRSLDKHRNRMITVSSRIVLPQWQKS